MEELLQKLEKKVKGLVEQRDQLKSANQQLNQGKFSLAREKDLLIERQQKAISQIETLVARLKAIGKIP